MNSNLKSRIDTILQRAYAEKWDNPEFSANKAHVCAELASIVYEEVSEYELKNASRIHLFASEEYRKIVKSKKKNTIMDILGEGGSEAEFFLVRGRYAIVFGTYFNDVLILSVRGTVFRRLWDWKANLDTRKFHLNETRCLPHGKLNALEFDDTYYHRGFFESIVPQFASIADEINKLRPTDELKIFWTGHSLGGAMAAIGGAMYNHHRIPMPKFTRMPGLTVSAYTFGMPRFCGLGAACSFAGPHHIYDKKDIVPTLPLRKMGFVDSQREYEISGTGKIELAERTDVFGFASHLPKLVTSVRSHAIERYAEAIAASIGVSRP